MHQFNRIDAKRMLFSSSGTCKIEKNCTSTMKVTKNTDSIIIVEVCYTHYGHQKELQHIWLSKARRQEIAAKLQRGVSKERILDDIRNRLGASLSRHHIVESRDILNIKKEFGLNEVQHHDNDQQSVFAWIKEWETSDSNPVLFYKLQGEECPDKSLSLSKNDVIVILQTEEQKHLARQFGHKGVCCDSTHGTNAYDFFLTTVLIVDEFGEGVPIAWCISNHEDYNMMKIFFSKVKDNVGSISPAWLMSDIVTQFYDAFVAVNVCQPKKLLCTWHVDKAWQEAIRQKINNVGKQADVYTMMRTVLEETDEASFQDRLSTLVTGLASSQETRSFYEYFNSYWASKTSEWAYCYRLREGINTNMFVEAFHRVFKYKYLRGKSNRRLDNCLFHLLKYSRDKCFERIIKLAKGKSSKRINMIHGRHRQSLELSFNRISSTESSTVWKIQSSEGAEKYSVEKIDEECDVRECMLRCHECKICCHV